MTDNVTPDSGVFTREVEHASERSAGNWLPRPLYQKPASEFESEDVSLLSSLEEGWFVEFKERLPDAAKLARSISSFANSHGGLLVIGAKEEQRTRRLAHLTPMCAEAAEQCVVRAREAVTSHVVPPPFFEAKAVEVDSLDGAVKDRWIVVISVLKGSRGPYLHSNGCIYVRIGDAAAPHPLADLTQQERMWTESMSRKAKTKARIELLSQQLREGTPSIHLVVLADDVVSRSGQITFDVFREIALAPHQKSSGAPFDHVQTLDTSFVARRTETLVEASSLLWDYDWERQLHFIKIPVATHFWSGEKIDNPTEQFGLSSLAQLLASKNAPADLMILNLLPTLYFLSIIIRKIQLIYERQRFRGELKMNARVVDARGTVPFLGTPEYFNQVNATTFPYVVRDIGFFRNLDDPSTWDSLDIDSTDTNSTTSLHIDISTSLALFAQIARSLGISPSMSLNMRDGDPLSADIEPIAGMFAEVLSSSFSFTSQQNPKASR